MNDAENIVRLEVHDGQEILLPIRKTTIIRHIAGLAMYDHISYWDDTREIRDYIFRQAIPEDYEDILDILREREFMENSNVREVGELTLAAYRHAMDHDSDVTDFVPEGWVA